MAKKFSLKRFLLIVLFLVLVAVAFVLLGGGKMLNRTGHWISGVGTKAEGAKEKIEHKATTVQKQVEKGIEAVKKPGEKK